MSEISLCFADVSIFNESLTKYFEWCLTYQNCLHRLTTVDVGNSNAFFERMAAFIQLVFAIFLFETKHSTLQLRK